MMIKSCISLPNKKNPPPLHEVQGENIQFEISELEEKVATSLTGEK